uniref:Undecaprenyl/decaprenyl-phosphate alpha-N-acetylglucosaminyl 1-phosphate transferase n=1 Tax=Fervidobacterium nodosum TaxID=2424 RepID=A0A7C5U3R5_9BACT
MAYKYGIVDKPDGVLKPHERVTPYLGGLAIFVSVIISTPFELISKLALTILVITGLVDDIRNVNPKVRLIVEFLVSFLLVYKYVGFTWLMPFYSVLVVALINAVNMMDGMDGVCAGVSIISALGLSLVVSSKYDVALLLSLVGALSGYLIYNFPPARIFMGDSGSYLVGGILSIGVLSSLRNGVSNVSPIISAFVFVSLFFFDLISGVLRRLVNSKPPFSGDREHIYDKIFKKFKDKRKTLYIMIIVQSVIFLFGYVAKSNVILSLTVSGILFVCYMILLSALKMLRY